MSTLDKCMDLATRQDAEIARLRRRLTAAVAVLDAITTPDGQLSLPKEEAAMARLEAAFAAAKEVA